MEQQTPKNINILANSKKIYDSVEKIGDKFGLHIDQMGELDAEIRCILLQIHKSSDFVDNICQRLEIERDLAEKVAEEVNKDIFEAIKSEMKSETEIDQPNRKNDISALERIGDFKILKDNGGNGDSEKSVVGDGNKDVNDNTTTFTADNAENGEKWEEETHTVPIIDTQVTNPLESIPKQPTSFIAPTAQNTVEEPRQDEGRKVEMRIEQKPVIAKPIVPEPIIEETPVMPVPPIENKIPINIKASPPPINNFKQQMPIMAEPEVIKEVVQPKPELGPINTVAEPQTPLAPKKSYVKDPYREPF